MLENLEHLDRSLLFEINKSWTHSWLDWFFPFITEVHHQTLFKYFFVPVVFVFIILKLKRIGIAFLFFLLLSVGMSDFIGGRIIKPFFERPRPSVAGLEVMQRAPQHGGFSFISNHAANMFSISVFVLMFYPWVGRVLLVYAVLIAYSRVYCGVHYPSDVIGGALIGALVGFLIGILNRITLLKISWFKSGALKNG